MRTFWFIAVLALAAVPTLAPAQPPPGIPATPPVTKDQAKQIYDSLDPATQQKVRDEVAKVKAQADSNPGFKAWLKSIYKAWFGK